MPIRAEAADGTVHEFPDGTADAVIDKAMKGYVASSVPQDEAPAPRWDVLGDIGRAAKASATALADDVTGAFVSPQTLARQSEANRQRGGLLGGMFLDQVDSAKRVGGLVKAPFDAAGVALSPVTGAVNATLGSALSYVIPTTKEGEKYGFQSDPKRAADEILGQASMLAAPRGINSPALATSAASRLPRKAARADAKLTNRAIERVNARALDDGLNPQDVATAQREANTRGEQVTLLDLGNKNVKGLGGAVYRAPGPAGRQIDTFLEGRDAASGPKLAADVGELAQGSSYHTTQGLLDSRSAAARDAYVDVEGIGPVHSERLQQFLDTPEVQQGLRRGLKLERQDAIAKNRPFKDSDFAITGYQDGNWDMPIFDKVPTMKSMMVANEGLGAQIADMVHPQTGRLTKDGVALKGFRDAFQGELDKLSGGKYRSARDAWGGPTQSMEAVREGKQHFSRTESNQELAAEFNAMSESDKDFYRLAAAESKIDQMERAPDASDKSKRIINSERDRKRFRMLFKSDSEADSFIQAVDRSRRAFDTKTDIKGNSKSAQRHADDANEDVSMGLDAAHALGSTVSGNWLGAAKSLYRLKRDLGLRNNPNLNSEIARILTDSNLSVSNSRGILDSVPIPQIDRYFGAPLISGGGVLPALSDKRKGR